MKLKSLHLALFATSLCASPLAAQDFYFGGGLAYSAGTSDNVTGGDGEADLSAGMVTLILGQRFAAGTGFWGWETSADLSFGAETENATSEATCSEAGAEGSYLCEHDATLRIVGIYGAPMGQGTEFFGSLGIGMLTGDFATSTTTVESASTYGLTAGIGVNREFANGMIGRGELIYDDFRRDTQDEYSSEYSGVTVRLGILRKF